MKQIKNWTPVIASFLEKLTNQGATLDAYCNGEDDEVKIDQSLNIDEQIDIIAVAINEVDVGEVFIRVPGERGRHYILIVLGNEPEEIVADHSDHAMIDRAWELHAKEWITKKVPTQESPY